MAGVNQPGVSYQFHTSMPAQWGMIDDSAQWLWNRQKQARAAVQLPQSAYSALHVPYVLAGLGQTNGHGHANSPTAPSNERDLTFQAEHF